MLGFQRFGDLHVWVLRVFGVWVWRRLGIKGLRFKIRGGESQEHLDLNPKVCKMIAQNP